MKKHIILTIIMLMLLSMTASAAPVKVGKLPYIYEQYFSVRQGRTFQLHVANYSGVITWSSKDPWIASVNKKNGIVHGKVKGTTYITASLGKKKKVQCTAKCYVEPKVKCKR